MKRTTLALLCAAALLAVPAVADDVAGTIEIGGHGAKDTGNPGRAAEYRSTDSGPDARLDLRAVLEGLYLEIGSRAWTSNDQQHALTFELGRMVRSHTTFTKLPHRLGHDSLANLAGSIADVKIVYATDTDPGARYGIRYDELANRTDIQIPGASWLIVSTDYREQWREGHAQSMSVSHCYSCHIISRDRAVDEHTRDAGLSARATFGTWSVVGSVSSRDFRERSTTPTRVYELAQHPSTRQRVFDDRVVFDEKSGAIPYDWVPTQEKDTAKLRIANGDLGGFAVSLVGVTSSIENTHTGNEVDYDGLALTLARRLGERARLSFYGRTYSIDSTDYYYDANEPAAVAGPYAGKTYRERYDFDPDFLRESTVDRDVIEANARLVYRLAAKTSLIGQYLVRSIDRATYEVAPGETATLEQRLKLTLATRPAKGFQLRAAATLADISHPFMSLDAACNPEAMQTTPTASPIVPGSTQYYQIHAARVADLTASPSRYAELRLSGSYQFGSSSLASVTYQWWDGDNDDQDLTDWSKTLSAVTANLMWAPTEKAQLFTGVSYGTRELETYVCIPLMDG